MKEVELKLVMSEEAVDALDRSGVLPPGVEAVLQRSVYYDTPRHALAKAGMSLRLRYAGGRCTQTIKAGGEAAAGLFVRSEWERPVHDGSVVVDDETPLGPVLGKKARDLQPVFIVTVERRAWRLHDGEAEIELVIDRGGIMSEAREAPLGELELELKRGPVQALFALARKIDAHAPVRLGVLTKSERGYLLSKEPRSAFKAEAIGLAADATTMEAFRQIAASCIRQFRRNEDMLGATRSAKALHQARVAVRRLRSAFSIFRPVLRADPAAERFARDLRELAAVLGDARDLDVLLERVTPGELGDRLRARREQAYGRVIQVLDSSRTRAMLLDLVEWLSAGEWMQLDQTEPVRAQPAREFAAAALDRFRRKVRKHESALAGPDDEPRHELRKEAKRLRYASEFFEQLFDTKRERRRHKRFLAALEDIQDDLGKLNDMATAPELLRKFDVMQHLEATHLLTSEGKDQAIAAATRAHRALAKTKPFWRPRAVA